MIRIYDCQTGETIDREMTDVEYAQHQKDLTRENEQIIKNEIKEREKTELLKRLGITAEEAALLLS